MFNRLSMVFGMRKEWMGMMWMKAPSVEEQEVIVDYLKTYSLKPITPGTPSSLESPEAISLRMHAPNATPYLTLNSTPLKKTEHC
jgi:hypothetical protein